MSEKLEIIISATDAASGVLHGIGKALGGLGSLAGGVLTVGLGAATAAVAGLGAGLAFSVGEAMGAQETLAQLDAVLKSTGGAAGVTADMATDLATSLSKVTKFSDDAILAGENMLLTFTNIGKDVFPDATAVLLDMAQAMGTDVKSQAIQLGKALNDPINGITALTRVGVTFTDEQKKLIEELVKTGKVAEAQQVILDELNKEFGGSAEAAGKTFAGRLEILKNRLLEVAESIGMAVIPLLERFMDNVIMPLVPIVEDAANAFGAFLTALGEGDIGGAFDALGEFESIQNLLNLLGLTGEQFRAIGPAVESFVNALLPVLQGDFSALQNLIPPGLQAQLEPLGAAVLNLASAIVENFPAMQAAGATLFAWLQQAFGVIGPALIANLTTAINMLAEIWRNHGETIMAVITVAFQIIVAVVGGALILLGGLIAAGLTLVNGVFNAGSELLKGNWRAAWDIMLNTFRSVWQIILSALQSFLTLALSIVGTNLAAFTATWQANFDMLVLIVYTVTGKIIAAIASLIRNVVNIIRGAAGEFYNAGRAIMDMFAAGIMAAIDSVITAVSSAIGQVTGMLDQLVQSATGVITLPGSEGGTPVGQGQGAGGAIGLGGSSFAFYGPVTLSVGAGSQELSDLLRQLQFARV